MIYNDGRVRSIEGKTVKGPDARKKESLTIVNVNGKKTSIHVPLTDEVNITYGKTFNADNIHKLDESNPNYDKDLLDVIFKKLEPYGYLNEEIKTHEQVDKILDVLFEDSDINTTTNKKDWR